MNNGFAKIYLYVIILVIYHKVNIVTVETILTFATISLLLVISPGPNGVLFLKTVPLHGTRNAMSSLYGICTATYAQGALSFFGLSALVLSSARLFMFIKIVGALYLLYLGVKSLYSVFKKEKELKDVLDTSIKKEKQVTHKFSFMEGFLTQILNPKGSMFYLAALPQLIDFRSAQTTDIFVLVSIHAFAIFIWFTCFIFLLGKGAKAFQSNFVKKSIQSFTGTAFIYLSYKILSIDSSVK